MSLTLLLTAPAIFGQAGQQHLPYVDVRETSKTPSAESNIVTVQELSHVVPKKALKEAEKAEIARGQARSAEAIEHYHRAIDADPEFVAARNNLAVMYLLEGNGEAAAFQLEEAAKIDAHNSALFANLTLAYTTTNRLDAAERAARTRLALDKTTAKAHLLLGLVLVQEGKFSDEALRCIERAGDEDPMAHLLAGRFFLGQGNAKRARAEIQIYLSTGNQDNHALAMSWLEQIDHSQRKSAAALP